MKILANDGISLAGQKALEQAGYTVITDKVAQEELIDYINKEELVALLVRSATKVRKDLIDACPGLKLIGRGGVGMDNIDVSYARSKDIKVINTPAASSQSVAELMIGQLFSMVRGTYDANRQMPIKGHSEFAVLKKKYAKGIELRGKKLGIIGFGRIGQSLASYALGCGVEVLAADLIPGNRSILLDIPGYGSVDVNVAIRSMDDVLSECDFISLHVPKQNDGTAVIGKAEIAKMKDGVYLLNAARGGSIDEDALMEALDSGKVASVALDVFEGEPSPREDLIKHPKLVSTPHIGAATKEAQDRIGLELADQIMNHLGETVSN